jgi:hypothetical protein
MPTFPVRKSIAAAALSSSRSTSCGTRASSGGRRSAMKAAISAAQT